MSGSKHRESIPDSQQPSVPRRRRKRLSGWRGKLAVLTVSALICCILAEVLCRLYWSQYHDIAFLDVGNVLYAFYPELEQVDRDQPSRADRQYSILFLGGSVLDTYFSQAERELQELFSYRGQRDVKVYNLAKPAHTSRDSRLKYETLADSRFDLVVFYHAINEARANNVPPEYFQQDYSHYAWYELVNGLAKHHGTARFALPLTLRYLGIRIRQSWLRDRYVPIHGPRAKWLRYGGDLRSTASFEDNLRAILETAASRGDTVLLMTFATHVSENYSFEAFNEKRLEYGLHLSPIETWGTPDNVIKAVKAHNQVIEDLAGTVNAKILFVDQAKLMRGRPEYFNDACHFSVAGSSQFVKNLFPQIWADAGRDDIPK